MSREVARMNTKGEHSRGNAGYFIQVCADYSQVVNRYAFLLVE